MGQVDGKIALVTGGASGIGEACVETLAREGAAVVISDIDDGRGNDLASSLNAAGRQAIYLRHDVTDETQWQQVVAEIERRHGRLDILVANAGIGIMVTSIAEMSLADWRRQTAVNLDGVFLSVKYCLPLMRRSGGGSIIITSSIAGLRGSATLAGYCATKGGVRLFGKAIAATAEEMGAVLKRTSFSPNIKERMDASCAVFDAKAQLVAQAEHVPVHLGSMLRSVEKTVAAAGGLDDGDVVIVNDPFTNGSHLPDITVVAPVFSDGRHIAYVATRAHHADVGRMEPGSMPGNSHEIYQEGLVIPAVKLYRAGELQDDVMRLILANVRTPEERRGDLNAQLASLRIGERRIGELAARSGAELVTAGFEAILDYTERRMRRRLAEFPSGTYR